MTTSLKSRSEPAAAEENGGRSNGPMPSGRRSVPRGDTRGYMLRRLLVVTDVVALAIAFFLVELYGGFDGGLQDSVALDYALLAASIPVWIVLVHAFNLYHVDTRSTDHKTADEVAPIFQLTTVWSWSILLVASLTHVRTFTLTALVLFWVLTFVLLLTLRAAVRWWARRRTWYLQNALIVGSTVESRSIAARILRHPEYGINVVATIEPVGDSFRSDTGAEGAETVDRLGPIPLLRGEVDIPRLVQELDVDRVLLTPSVESLGEQVDLVFKLSELFVHVDVIPSWGEVMGSRLEFHEMEGLPLLTFPSTSLSPSSLLLKRALDIAVAGCALAVFSPVLAICALAIKLDSRGPVFFRQRRVGKDGRSFRLIKFRSMCSDAEARQAEIADLTLHGGGTENGIFKVARDPRVTRVGAFLRRYSLDELPQFFNILRGDMSLVGPRPLPENEHERITGRYRRRGDLMPGLTGPWQVHGRSNIPFEGMVDLDYLYVSNWSLWLDVKLILRTFAVVGRGQGAY